MRVRRAPLIVLEGIDFAGKSTQATRLRKYLDSMSRRNESYHFPSDETALGAFIRQVLGRSISLPPDALFALFSANRLEHRMAIEKFLAEGVLIICDRYCPSAYAYGGAKVVPVRWLRSLESRMPTPDIVILLDIAPEKALARAKGRDLDSFEEDVSYLSEVRERYLDLSRTASRKDGSWIVLNGAQSEEAVAAQILDSVMPLIK
jgi:dTMP kinase